MSKVKAVENRIKKVEGFDVCFLDRGGRATPKTREIPMYDYKKGFNENDRVAEWKKNRFLKKYPGYEVHVLDGDGKKVNMNMKVKNVRKTYE